MAQTEITLNLLRQSNATPTVSAHAHLSGPFDYNKMPLAPMGCGAQVHKKTDKRGTWTYHSVDGWYLFTSQEHYRTQVCHVKATKNERLTNMLQLSHKNITNPTNTHTDKVMNAISACAEALRGVAGRKTPEEFQDLQEVVEITGRTVLKKVSVLEQSTTQPATAPPRVHHTTTRIT